MSEVTFTGFVVIDGEQVLTYEQLRTIGFVGPTAESEYLGGMHGINGMFQVRATPKQTELMDDHGLGLALVQTPYFTDRRLAMEPETDLEFQIFEDRGEIIHLSYLNGFTRVAMGAEDNGLPVTGKLSIGMYSSNAPQPPVNLMADIGWNSVIPVMPSPADVLAQLGSQKSLADQFAEAFASANKTPTPAPAPAPEPAWEIPKAPWSAPPENQQAPEPQPDPVVVKPAAPTPDDLLNSMFGVLLR